MSKPVLITGGAGFIGSTLAEKLLERGQPVVCIDNFDPFYPASIKESNLDRAKASRLFTFINGDIRQSGIFEKIFKDYKIDIAIHLAAKAGVRPSILDPKGYFDVNVNGTLNLLEAMKTGGVKKLVFASSSSVYGNNEKIPYTETDIVDFPISPYAGSKKSGELLTHIYHHLYDISVTNLRFFTVYGPRQRPDLAIHKFFTNLYHNKPIDVYGDGTTSRDYTFVDDTISGIVKAMDFLDNHFSIYEIINLGNNSPVTLHELVSMIEDVTGKKFTIHRLPMQEGDVNITFANIEKAKKLLNYQPTTILKEGLLKFKAWYEERI